MKNFLSYLTFLRVKKMQKSNFRSIAIEILSEQENGDLPIFILPKNLPFTQIV